MSDITARLNERESIRLRCLELAIEYRKRRTTCPFSSSELVSSARIFEGYIKEDKIPNDQA